MTKRSPPYNKYTTRTTLMIQAGTLSPELKKMIPRSTFYNLKSKDLSHYIGFDFDEDMQSELEFLKQLVQNPFLLDVVKAICTVFLFIRDMFYKIPKTLSFEQKTGFIEMIDKYKKVIGFKAILDIMQISSYKYDMWKSEITYVCKDSAVPRCLRRHPNQLTPKEVGKIKELCGDDNYKGWSIFAIAVYAKRQSILTISLNTWYKYVHLN